MKKILIMGATSGMGRRIATDFAHMGWRVGAAGRDEEALRKLSVLYPDSIVTERIDITHDDCPTRMLRLIDRMEGMDVLLQASGVMHENPELNLRREVTTLETNVVGFARVMATAYRYFRDLQRTTGDVGGRIAAITSVASTRGIGPLASYSASKRFQRTYLEALEQLARKQKVHVDFTEIRPGWVRTPLVDDHRDYPMIMTLDYAVPLVEAAILKGKRVATVDWRWRLLCALWGALPRELYVKLPLSVSKPKKA